MPDSVASRGDSPSSEARALLSCPNEVGPDRFTIVGKYCRFDEGTPTPLAPWERTKPILPCRTKARMTECFLGIPDA
jgi:hypothetical protein